MLWVQSIRFLSLCLPTYGVPPPKQREERHRAKLTSGERAHLLAKETDNVEVYIKVFGFEILRAWRGLTSKFS